MTLKTPWLKTKKIVRYKKNLQHFSIILLRRSDLAQTWLGQPATHDLFRSKGNLSLWGELLCDSSQAVHQPWAANICIALIRSNMDHWQDVISKSCLEMLSGPWIKMVGENYHVMAVAIKVRYLSLSTGAHLEENEVCSKTLTILPSLVATLDPTCLYPYLQTWLLYAFIWFIMKRMTWNVVRIVMSFGLEQKKYHTLSLLLTVDNHIDIFDIRRGDVVAGLTFIATCLISHNAYDVQILISIQRLCCKTKKEWLRVAQVKGIKKKTTDREAKKGGIRQS